MAESMDLRAFRWKNRVIVVFAADDRDELLADVERQIRAQRRGFEERHMRLVVVFRDGRVRVDEDLPGRMDTTALRVRVDRAPEEKGSRVLLIGKDGGIKMDSDRRFDLEMVFQLVDSMPMRRREMAGGKVQ